MHYAFDKTNREVTPLCELASYYGSDKVSRHAYTPFYYELLKDRRESVKKVLEIGILEGASLRMWRDFFPNAIIYGADYDVDTLVEEDRIHSIFADQTDPGTIFELGEDFDLIVDDGSHQMITQVMTFHILKRYLARGGIYVIEDVSTPELVQKNLYYAKFEKINFDPDIFDDRLLVYRNDT